MRLHEVIVKTRTTVDRRIKKAKEKLKKRPGEGVGAVIAAGTHKKNAGPHDNKGYKRNPKHKKDEES